MIMTKRLKLSGTVLRNAAWNALFVIGLYILLNIFFLIILNFEAARIIDNHLIHELEHFMLTMHVENDSLVVEHDRELRESDLLTVTPTSFFLQVYNQKDGVLLQSENLHDFGPITQYFPPDTATVTFANTRVAGHELRSVYNYLPDTYGKPSAVIQLSAFKTDIAKFMPVLFKYNLYSFPFIILLIIIASILLARKSFAPINKIINLANRISATELNQRLDYKAGPDDELGKLRDTLNHLFDRLQKQFDQVSQFTDNASHQLMSPLTVLKSELEFIQRKSHQNKECREVFSVMTEQTDRMIAIVRNLLIMAKECHACRQNQKVLNISKTLSAMPGLFPDKNLVLDLENGLYTRGNSEYFALAIQNIIDNAFKYSGNGLAVDLRAKKRNNQIEIHVCDRGIGIPVDQRKRIFERFFRLESGIASEGFGLGLSLVNEIISAMGGMIEVNDNHPLGTCFLIKLNALSVEG